MPKMNGFEAFKEIQEINNRIPIIALTAYAMSSDREKALEMGFDDYLSKPLLKEKLIEVINKFLKKNLD